MPLIPRPPLPAEIQPYIANSVFVEKILTGTQHASNSENPRPMEDCTLADLRDGMERMTAPIRKNLHKSLCTIFWNNCNSVAIDQGLRVPARHLWWAAMPGDTVLLSDGVTHHYTTVGAIDRQNEKLEFIDPWPDDFFLQSGRNMLDIEADGCRINREAFELATVGLLTWDTTDLLDNYFEAFPEQGGSAEQRMRAGHAIMAAGPEYLASYAIKHFVKAMQFAYSAGDSEVAAEAAAQVWLAGFCAGTAARLAGDEQGTMIIEMMIAEPNQRVPIEKRLAHLTPYQLCRLANSAGNVGDMQLVEKATELAIEKNQECEDAYWLRALAHVISEPAAAVADIQHALDLNLSMIRQLELELNRLGRPRFKGPVEHKLDIQRNRRIDELNVMIVAASNNGDHLKSRMAVHELQKSKG